MKQFDKKGFSLLEVMLAVAIMAIASSMIMYGFMASMNYANNSSIYARVAAANTGKSYSSLATAMYNTSRNGTGGRYHLVQTNLTTDEVVTLYSPDTGLSKFITARSARLTDDPTVGTSHATRSFDIARTTGYTDSVEGATGYADATVADNRTMFFYITPGFTWPTGYSFSGGRCSYFDTDANPVYYNYAMMRRGGDPVENGNFRWVERSWNAEDHDAYRTAVFDQWDA